MPSWSTFNNNNKQITEVSYDHIDVDFGSYYSLTSTIQINVPMVRSLFPCLQKEVTEDISVFPNTNFYFMLIQWEYQTVQHPCMEPRNATKFREPKDKQKTIFFFWKARHLGNFFHENNEFPDIQKPQKKLSISHTSDIYAHWIEYQASTPQYEKLNPIRNAWSKFLSCHKQIVEKVSSII